MLNVIAAVPVLLALSAAALTNKGTDVETPSQQLISGEVQAGNYTYFKISKPGSVALVLITYEGDADLYVSSVISKPTFDFDGHQLLSTTCGVDYVLVPYSTERPVYVGIYGHPSHVISRYVFSITMFEGKDCDEELASWTDHVKVPSFDPTHWDSVFVEEHGRSFLSVLLHVGEIFSAVILFLLDNFVELSIL